jgi:hypothetical protein
LIDLPSAIDYLQKMSFAVGFEKSGVNIFDNRRGFGMLRQ